MNTLTAIRADPSAVRSAISGDTFAKMINLSGRRRFTSQRVVLYTVLAAQKVPHKWYVDSGAHTFPVWKNDLYHFASLLFR